MAKAKIAPGWEKLIEEIRHQFSPDFFPNLFYTMPSGATLNLDNGNVYIEGNLSVADIRCLRNMLNEMYPPDKD